MFCYVSILGILVPGGNLSFCLQPLVFPPWLKTPSQIASAIFSATLDSTFWGIFGAGLISPRDFGQFAFASGYLSSASFDFHRKIVIFRKRCAPRFHAECTGHCVESFHEEPIREKNVIFKKVASWHPGNPGGRNLIHENNIFPGVV